MNLPIYKQYAELTVAIKKLEEERDGIKEALVADLKENELQTYRSELGTFSMGTRKSWKYSPLVAADAGLLKELKKKEEEDGTAESKETEYLAFR